MALKGLKVIELAGLAPAPFCGMIFSDFGAKVTRVDKPNSLDFDTLSRGKRSVILDLQKLKGTEVLKILCHKADVLIEPFRAGVMEKLHLGPSELFKINPRLVYARMTGFGQNGPFAKMAGHDINYIALSGILSILGKADQKPHQPVNLLGDFAGGGLLCALGICMALLERNESGKGQVIDANMVEGSAYLGTWIWTTRNPDAAISNVLWSSSRGKSALDGGAPFYQTYITKDGKFMAVGALEPQFYSQLLEGLNLDINDHPHFEKWEETTETFTKIFASKTQEEWCTIFDYKDACVTPVMPLESAHTHCHNAARHSFFKDGRTFLPNPAPGLSRTPGNPSFDKPISGQHTREVLLEEGYSDKEIKSLISEGVVYNFQMKSAL